MDSIGTEDYIAPIARSPLDAARGRRRRRLLNYPAASPAVNQQGESQHKKTLP